MMSEEVEKSSGPGNKPIKVTLVGDSGVGKTCILMTLLNNKFPEEEAPSYYENCSTLKAGRDGSFEVPYTMNISGTEIMLGLTDTIGTDKYRRFREIFSVNTDMFLVCFSVTDPESFENVKNNWLTEIKLLTPKAPFILVGTKSDLREDKEHMKENKKTPISIQHGIKMGKIFGAKAYVECSSISNIGIQELFTTVVMVLYPELFQKNDDETKKDRSFCVIS
ncbi:hypothetical protein ACJMK2_036019 [Sinanodonta woodiana]|uniref:Uncharacterized protein n=1 Tax=Sinanodonta woodiana TaxID=1069815 RepID=A0ABD3WGZ2_SINWO